MKDFSETRSTTTVTTEVRGHCLLIGLNRPDKYNAFTPEMYHQVAAAYFRLEHDPDLRVAVLFGHGDHTTAGLELDAWAPIFSRGAPPPLHEGELDPFYVQGAALTKPVVMAVQGYCYTCGVEMLLNTDVRVAADNTRFAQLEVARGFFACGGATIRLPREIGWGQAQRYLLTGDSWTAAQALDWGLVQEVVAPGEQLQAALAIAERIAKAAPLGVRGSLASSKLARTDGEMVAKEALFRSIAPLLDTEDMQEGIQSFLERREAKFKGR